MNENVNTSASVISTDNLQSYHLKNFGQTASLEEYTPANPQQSTSANIESEQNPVEILLNHIQVLSNSVQQIDKKITTIEQDGIKGKDLEKQVVQAMKDLKNYASFFEQASLQMESKLLKTSIALAQKIIGIEVGQNSANIAKETISNILDKIKTASKVTIHLNPKDYVVLKDELNLEPFIILNEDPNVALGGVVIASDLGNFDGNIEAKVKTLIDSLDTII
jgi:flagellar assembly protein FliH